MSEEQFVEGHQGDPDCKNSADLVERVFEGKVDRAFYPSSIRRAGSVEMVAVGRLRGFTSSEFKDDFGVTLSEAGYK
eukprot:1178048-Pyramimonas_sp.AAC.1